MMKKYALAVLFYMAAYGLTFTACGSKESGNDGPAEPNPPGTKEVSVTVMTYNLWASRPGNLQPQNMIEMAEVIKRANPDLVALQEVDKLTKRNPIDVTKELAERTGMKYYFFAKAMDYSGGEYGEAVLSKLPFKETKAYSLGFLPEYPKSEMRSMAMVTVEKEGKEFHFVGTHLDHEYDANREKQARDIVNIFKTFTKPVILGGDLNSLPDSEAMRILRGHFSWGCLNNNCAFTFPATNPNRTIDYLMYAPTSAISVKSYQAYSWASSASDHLPVLATFVLK